MFKQIKKKIIIGLVILAVLIIGLFGPKIPLINKISIFSDNHEHVYKPVLDQSGAVEYWTCAMHPSVRLKEPGQCPICGMDLIAVENNVSDKKNETHGGMKDGDQQSVTMLDHSSHGAGIIPRTQDGGELSSEFIVSPQRQQLIGVKTEAVSVRSIDKVIRTVGKVELDETKIEHIHSKVSGWIDKVFVDFTWKHVKKGDPLFSIYSPDLVSTQQEYLLGLKSKNVLGQSEFSEISEGA
ncbi:MAG: efflux RND transporter periplasmic adaptor subunit, partial [Candidatus Dadabacteria bacterium]|nr:efflux RND transporter periplasmic adaptor subunit [Candidatus Dadabacteria bacterium]NIS09930.1 efflux RND transporter periplasmic adaptor subunit [Candidatus Dadabacteria bacterium]NIV41818.1 hypothetical protein [Candidatus Dadabacteria bacterium]NIX16349.1 hypothetical protein [Candidatus Dadabacteria bacterium]NIY21398.1 hypothetical protein [Candidatus Dadabacteria bacterium]